MSKKSPYQVLKSRYFTEKTSMLSSLKEAASNRSLARMDRQKIVFVVDPKATKIDVRQAFLQIYPSMAVASVNMICVKPKVKRRTRHGRGKASSFKKAIVTLKPGLELDL